MTSSKKNSGSQSIDKWLENLFLDPLTNLLDETAFRLDIFESGTQFIIEADIPEQSTETTVTLQENTVVISVNCDGKVRLRKVDWPFDVREHEVIAYKIDQVLEISIDKEKTLAPVDRLIEIKR
ncbi:hypothetical protein M3175_11900 [Robertmurraya korlensis]|uniref:hypothetical protein n=1 Tax=Robertmurraya korlensis TaxID=519977 RepID=UPI00203A889E|nr:hypothetical protein [Robertmurraya korlensis]MCM3601438.1 hypothetical protein [Robertmurraya korlensis]